MAQEITLPVKLLLDNLQSIVKEMRSQLGTLKVDSSGYKKLEGVINGIEKRIQDIQVIASRPIMDEKLFVSIEKDVSHIYDDITKLGIEAGRIKFSDLSLTGDQKQKLQEFDNQLKTIKDDLKNIEEKAKTAFLSTDAGKIWQELNPKDATKSFSRITEIIQSEVIKLKLAVEEAKATYNDYLNTIQVSKNMNAFLRGKDSLADKIKAAGMFDKIFTSDGNRFKNGGRNELEKWLKTEFSLSDDAIKSITEGSGKLVLLAFTEMKENVRAALKSEQSRLSAERKTAMSDTNNGHTLTDKIAEEEAKERAILAALNATVLATEARRLAEINLRAEEEKTKALREEYVNGILKLARTYLLMGTSCELAKSQLSSLNNIIKDGLNKLASLDAATGRLQGISNFVNRYVGAYAIIRKVSTAIRNAFNNIKELDKTITSIAVVTNMSLEDLWGKVGQYTLMAQEYGVTTNDVYKVSQLFYQQGLQTSQVMSLTTETLKMAKIAGMDYTAATNAMTVAVRAFNIEMDLAQQVTDTYSALAAKFAVSSAEIANAMEKTASSAANVGMSIQSTSAFMSVMIQTTRESAQNIGSALKSIISRYGEMKASPASLVNVDGEEVAFNKVDTALKSIGISIKDASGQFRDFDDVIMELASKWDTLDNNTQRYIATVMAGNRQQSRFIALVSNYDELSRAMNVASNAENASIVQVAKTMDSLESKTNQLKNAFSQLYLDLHIESGLKSVYDWLTRIITTVGKLGTLTGALPTLMNIFGFGAGSKKIFNEINDSILKKKLTIETDNSLFEKEKQDIEAFLAQPHELDIKTNIDDTKLTNVLNVSASLTTLGLTSSLLKALGDNYNDLKLGLIYDAYKNGSLATSEGRKDLLENKLNVSSDNPEYSNLNNFLEQLGLTTNALRTLGLAAEEGGSAEKENALSKEEGAIATQEETLAKTEQTTTTHQVTDAEVEMALKTGASAAEVERLKDAVDSAKAAKLLEILVTKDNALAKHLESLGSKEAELADRDEAKASREAAGAKGGWAGKETAMKITGIATGAARMIGTAVTAVGAAHLDKSTDNIEASKLYTGIGNGLSMAGTGASMLMSLGPWGAAIGAIGGFLIGGLGAIIDGATMTLEERLALEKQEAKEAADESLKASAKTTDLSNLIDNIKQLLKVMYNSTEDMLAYKDAMNTMASEYPSLVNAYDEAGNAIISILDAEILLAETRLLAAVAANNAAKAEAKTRLTTIETLNDVLKKASALYSTGRNIKTFLDENGKSHSLYVQNSDKYDEGMKWFKNKINELEDAPKLSENATLEEYINAILWLKDNKHELKRNGLFSGNDNAQLQKIEILTDHYDATTHSFGKDEFNFSSGTKTSQALSEINTVLKNRSTDLNFSKASGVSDDLAYIYGFMGWDETIEITAERINEFEQRLSERVEGYEKLVEVLDLLLPIMDAKESLEYALLKEDTSKATKISTSNVAAKLIANQLEAATPEDLTTGAWSRSKDVILSAEYESVKSKATEIVVSWFTSLSEDALDKTLTAFDSMTEYISLDDLLENLGYTDLEDFITRSGLEEEDANQLIANWEKSFADANKLNRDRILKTIYDTEGNFNTEALGNLEKIAINDKESGLTSGIDYAEQIASLFDEEEPQIISKYADYFTSQLLEINDLAELGYTSLAGTRLAILDAFSNSLVEMTSELQRDVFGIITTTDFSSYDSILSAIEAVKDYAKSNDIDISENAIGPLKLLYDALGLASNDIIFNVNTLALSVTELITSASSKIDSILSINKSGLSFDKALEEYNTLAATIGSEARFDKLFAYDATLGKYVYSSEGLKAAIELLEKKLGESVELLNTTKDNYRTVLESLPEFRDTSETSKEYDAEGLKGILANYIPKDLSAYSDLLVELFINSGLPATLGNFYNYIEEQITNGEVEAEKAQQILNNYKNNKKNQYFQNIDWSALALGTDYYGTNQVLVDALAKEFNMQAGYTAELVFEEYLKTIKDPAARAEVRAQTNDAIIADKIGLYQSAIGEILTFLTDKYLSTSTYKLLEEAGTSITEINSSADSAVSAAQKFLLLLAEQIGKGGYTLELYNQDAKSILAKTLEGQTKEKSLLDFAGDNISADTLEGIANVFGKKLTDIVDVTSGEIQGLLGEQLQFNKLAGTYEILGTFEEFIFALEGTFGTVINRTSKLYVDALKAFNDTRISQAERVTKGITDELKNVLNAKGGEQINLALTFATLRDSLDGSVIEELKVYGASFEDGILTLSEGADTTAITQRLLNIAKESGNIITRDILLLSDSIDEVFKNMISAIQGGITGNLSRSSARDLATWAKNQFEINLDFTETKKGLKLSEDLAILLYTQLKLIDDILAQIVFDDLNKSLQESNENYKSSTTLAKHLLELEEKISEANSNGDTTRAEQYERELALAKEIAQVRTTTEDNSFNFMSNEIPSGQNNPLNYFENWSKAFKVMNEAAKGTGKDHNKMAYQDFYNIITEMSNLAATSNLTFLLGKDFEVNAKNAADLIRRGAEALSVASDGTLKVDLSKLGIDFASGAKNLKQDVGKGIKEVANSLIAMLDSMIQLLETIVAMEALGDIDVEGNGIDFGELFDEENWFLGADGEKYYNWKQGAKDAATKIIEMAETNEDLAKGLDQVAVNGVSMREMLTKAKDGIAISAEEAKAYHATLAAFYQAMQSGDYDLNDIYESLKTILAGTDFEGEIDVGDLHLTIKNGIVLERDTEGNYIVDGLKFKDENAALKALASSDLTKLENAAKTYNIETGKVTYTAGKFNYTANYNIETGEYSVEFSDGSSATSDSKEGINLAISTWLEMNKLTAEDITTENNGTASFTLTSKTGVVMDVEVDVETGEVKVNTQESIKNAELAKAYAEGKAAATAAAEKAKAEIEKASSESNTTATIDGAEITISSPIVKLAEGAELKLDLTGKKVSADNVEVELNLPKTTLVESGDSIKLDETLGIRADSTDLEITLTADANKHLMTSESDKLDVEDIPDIKGIANNVEVTIDSNTISSLSNGSVITLKDDINVLGTTLDLEISINEGTNIHLSSELEKIDAEDIPDVNGIANNIEISTDTNTLTSLSEGSVVKITNPVNAIADVGILELDLGEGLDIVANMGEREGALDIGSIGDAVALVNTLNINEADFIAAPDELNAEAKVTVKSEIESAQKALSEIESNINNIELKSPVDVDVKIDEQNTAYLKIRKLQEELKTLDNINPIIDVTVSDSVNTTRSTLDMINNLLASIAAMSHQELSINTTYTSKGIPPRSNSSYALPDATGNIGLAKAQGTLMGELGPELVVSKGRYFVAGLNGAEFVNLDTDAIVFNHLLTELLLKHGMSKLRGLAVTNERNAVAFALGNINGGPAMASAKAALAALKQLRALWKAIANMGAADLAGLGGSGGGGGGSKSDPKAFVKLLEIWYNWLQRIAVLEQKITYEEAKRSELASSFYPNGKEYVKSLKASLDYLKEEAAVLLSLVESQEEYFEKRRLQLNNDNGPFDLLYTFDEYGQLKYKNGKLEQLSLLVGRDNYGDANMTAQLQYLQILAIDPNLAKWMETDSSGNKIDKTLDDWYVSAVQAFWDKMDSDKEEMQSLHDSIEEHKKAVLEKELAMNEILREIEENLISLENKILDAIVESRLRQIDELLKQRDALEEASLDLIDGLSELLSKELDMYAQLLDLSELSKLQRQLAILLRSGGSISQITSLLKEISEKQQDAYFDAQLKLIDALLEASDNQLEKLDQLIELMTETLEYEKDHGLLWNLVYLVLAGTPELIAGFIQLNTSAYWTQSAAEVAKNMREDLFSALKYVTYKEELGSIEAAAKVYSEKAVEEQKAKEREEEAKKKAAASSASTTAAKANASSSGSNSGASGSGGNTPSLTKDTPKANNGDPKRVLNVLAAAKGVIQGATSTVLTAAAIANAGGISNAVNNILNNVSSVLKNATSSAKTTVSGSLSSLKSFITGKAAGGYVNHGIYELGEMGTETVLTAEQTKVLRDNILSNRPNSLISLLKSYNEGYSDINKATEGLSQVSDNSTYIENATVEMHVEKIDNDYDAQRAGEQALEKIMQIARKSLGANRIRR